MSFVCEKCVNGDGEPGLHQFMVSKGQPYKVCDYCCNNSSSPTIELNQFIDHILECFKEHFHISLIENKKSIELSTFVIEDMLYPASLTNKKLYQEAYSILSKKGMGKAYLTEKKKLINTWDDFSKHIKQESRFFFSSKSEILEKTIKIIRINNLIKKIKEYVDVVEK